jgi:UDP-glucose 4-epimerase
MKILVTGGAGFIGSHVTKQLLDQGFEVIVYDDLSRGFKKLIDPRATFVKGSISERTKLTSSLKGVEAVVHMAAFIIVPESVEKPKLYWENNVAGTKTLLEAMGEMKVKKIIFSSSATVYGDPDKPPLTEQSPVKKAANPYGQTKIEMENLIKKAHEGYGLSAIILRYFNPYGPNELHEPETHAVPNFITAVLNHRPTPLYWKGEQVRDFIYVEDLASAHIAPLHLDGFHVFNVGTGRGTKVIHLVEEIFSTVGYKTSVKDLGKRAGDVPELYTSPEKIQNELGWRSGVSLKEGLKRTIEFYKSLA